MGLFARLLAEDVFCGPDGRFCKSQVLSVAWYVLGMLLQGSGAGLCLPAVLLSAVAGGISLEVSPASDDVKARARPSLAAVIGWLLVWSRSWQVYRHVSDLQMTCRVRLSHFMDYPVEQR